jgi:subtilase family serine protease
MIRWNNILDESAESEDTNNQATTSYGVVAPDFVVTAITLTPTSLRAGRTFKASITVKNEGTAAGVPGRLQVWADQPASQNCAAVGNKSVTLTSLAAGASRTVSVTGLSAGVAGDKKLRTFIDSRCAVAEADEGNNQTELTYTVAP